MFEVKWAGCCAVAELHNISRLSGPEAVVDLAVEALREKTYDFDSFKPYIYFTGVVGARKRQFEARFHTDTDENYGQALADYIVAEKLGTIFDGVSVQQNWSGNMVKIWFWMPDYAALKARYWLIVERNNAVAAAAKVESQNAVAVA